ncbi:hypothetical protein CMI38_00830 [Candidatus Pacearchaeota archaeon]|nr:hypothetical protein [Candidatus Pacearchaeota archaeon]|tara:strand:+ start:886 stop:1206 length:321 start_codon:yes stop_codon:yes gene_type:complete
MEDPKVPVLSPEFERFIEDNPKDSYTVIAVVRLDYEGAAPHEFSSNKSKLREFIEERDIELLFPFDDYPMMSVKMTREQIFTLANEKGYMNAIDNTDTPTTSSGVY